MRAFAGCIVAVALTAAAAPRGQGGPDLGRHFQGLEGAFVLFNGATGEFTRHNAARAARRFPPCSTFKIPNTAILLETAAAPDPSFTLKYDPALKQPEQWAQDFDLRGAFKASALWYYQAMARRAGMEAERRFVEAFSYGNRDTSGGIDRTGDPFWVDGSLRISPDEQVEFLRRFYEGRLGLSERTTRLTKEIMVADQTPRWRLSAKTGACRDGAERTSNWYVGYVERPGVPAPSYFALQLADRDFGRAFKERIAIARAILVELKVLD